MTTSARSASRSVTFPFPSSPHWAPTTTRPGMALAVEDVRALVPVRNRPSQVTAHDRNGGAHLAQPGHGALPDLLAQAVAVEQVGGDEHRALLLPALVDYRVELLHDPVGGLLGADVVDVQEVDAREAAEEVQVRPP